VLMYGCGIGPVNYPSDRRLAARIINKYVDAITLREDGSLEELKSMGVTGPEIFLAADPALTLTPAPAESIDSTLLKAGTDPSGNYVCFALRPWPGFSERAADIAAAADELYFTDGLTPVFLSIDRIKDGAAAAEVTRRMKAPYRLLDGSYEAGTVIGIMSRMRAVVSMRLHALIFAAGHGVPLIGVVYDPKVSAFLRYIGREYYTELENASCARLLELVRGCIAENSGSTQRLAVEKLRDMEKVNRDVLKKYMS